MTADDTVPWGMQNLFSGANVSRPQVAVICAAVDRGTLSAIARLVTKAISADRRPFAATLPHDADSAG